MHYFFNLFGQILYYLEFRTLIIHKSIFYIFSFDFFQYFTFVLTERLFIPTHDSALEKNILAPNLMSATYIYIDFKQRSYASLSLKRIPRC